MAAAGAIGAGMIISFLADLRTSKLIKRQGKFERDIALYNAAVYRREASALRDAGFFRDKQIAEELKSAEGHNIAAGSKNAAGISLEAMAKFAYQSFIQRNAELLNAMTESTRLENQADITETMGRWSYTVAKAKASIAKQQAIGNFISMGVSNMMGLGNKTMAGGGGGTGFSPFENHSPPMFSHSEMEFARQQGENWVNQGVFGLH